MAGLDGLWSTSVLEPWPQRASDSWFSARPCSRAVRKTNCGPPTPSRSGEHFASICWSCPLSASNVLKLFQPAAGCKALETVLAMAQAVRVHDGTCYRCAAALGLRSSPYLQVCCAPRRFPLAIRHSHFSDRGSCARAAGSCSVSSRIVRLTVRDRPHVGGALGERAALSVLLRLVGTQRQPTGNGWPCAHGVDPPPGSCGDRPPTSVACMDTLVRLWCLA